MLPGGDDHFRKVDFSRNFGTALSTHRRICPCVGFTPYVSVVRSDMSQLCSCIPSAQAFSCPRWWYFSCDETTFIPFLIVLGLLQDVSRKLGQAKWGWWIQGGNVPQQCSVASKQPQIFCCCSAATSLASDVKGHAVSMQPWLSDTCSVQSEVCGTNLPCRDDSMASKGYMRVAGAGQKTLIILRTQFSCLAFTISIRKAQMTSLCSPQGSIARGKKNKAGNPKVLLNVRSKDGFAGWESQLWTETWSSLWANLPYSFTLPATNKANFVI